MSRRLIEINIFQRNYVKSKSIWNLQMNHNWQPEHFLDQITECGYRYVIIDLIVASNVKAQISS